MNQISHPPWSKISLTTPAGPAAFPIFNPLIAAATSSSEMKIKLICGSKSLFIGRSLGQYHEYYMTLYNESHDNDVPPVICFLSIGNILHNMYIFAKHIHRQIQKIVFGWVECGGKYRSNLLFPINLGKYDLLYQKIDVLWRNAENCYCV